MPKHTKIENGKTLVAIVYSPGFGAGWSTWQDDIPPDDGEIAKLIDEGLIEEAVAVAEKRAPDGNHSGLTDGRIYWVEEGKPYYIREYDGNESVIDQGWRIA